MPAASCVKPAAKTLIENSRLNNKVSRVDFKSFFRIKILSFLKIFKYMSSILQNRRKTIENWQKMENNAIWKESMMHALIMKRR